VKKPDWKTMGIRDAAIAVCDHLGSQGIDASLVGGACVSIYSSNAYESLDLDFVSYESDKKIGAALAMIGFKKTAGRHFEHPDCKYYAEFVSPPISIGEELIKKLKRLQTPLGLLNMLTPTDCVKDRLAAYIHWKDHQAFEQAIMVALRQRIRIKSIELWAKKERGEKAVAEFKRTLKEGRAQKKKSAP
jgi:hypothetical protein